ncbi:MAG: ATP-binding cassette domain-containing protein [Gammaproteobacteria bacterium]|nr:ATP-binding cassette domain-containing protein [Gammaproteobacteria bacterium]
MSLLQINQLGYQHCGPIDLQIDAAECIGVSGESGSGKSLLLRAIADLDEHAGQVVVNDVAAADMSAPDWRKIVAVLPADSQWWFDTVGEHFRDDQNARLTALGFSSDVMGWSISRMSSGEKQRLALLRLLNNRPVVLLLDEPTANLDYTNTLIFEQVVDDYLQQNNACAIWVSHDSDQLKRIAQRHFLLAEGRLQPC